MINVNNNCAIYYNNYQNYEVYVVVALVLFKLLIVKTGDYANLMNCPWHTCFSIKTTLHGNDKGKLEV